MSENRARQLASILKAIADLHTEKSEYITEWKDRLLRLENQRNQLGYGILSGQQVLPIDEPGTAA